MTESFFRNNDAQKPTGETFNLDDSDDRSGADSSQEEGFRSEEGRMAAVLAYIPFLCFVPLLSMKDNREARFHARQGVVLFLIEVVCVLFLIDAISDLVFKGLLVLAAGLSLAGIVFALQGKNYRLPIIGDLVDKAKL